MGKMSYIHYLCEKEDRNTLLEELGNEEMVDSFLEAHRNVRNNKNKEPYKKLNNMISESINYHKENKKKSMKESKGAIEFIINSIKDIIEPN